MALLELASQHKALTLAFSVAVIVIARLLRRSPVKNIQGPARPSFLLGHEYMLSSQLEVGVLENPWFDQYGEVYKTSGIFGTDALQVADPKALQYIMQTSGYHFPKAFDVRRITARIFGTGLVAASGSTHQRQRKVVNPAFSTPQLRTFLSVFQSATRQLAQKWAGQATAEAIVDVYSGLELTALDIIGKTGFDYDFNALSGESSVLGDNMRNLFVDSVHPGQKKMVYDALWRHLPTPILDLLESLPSKESTRFNHFQALSKQIVQELMAQKQKDGLDKDSKDILSVLARSNSSESEKLRISEEEVLAQAATFIFAGHDTTATTLAWLFYELSKHPDQQARLRAEISDARSRIADGEDFTPQNYDSMTFLTACMKEVLRLHPIVPALFREASRDDVIPLLFPITGVNGEVMNSIPVRKGQRIHICIARYNRLKPVWGNDADHWNPERFLVPDKKEVSLGVFANLMSFSGGLQGCIGWRFAVIELQTVTTEMVSRFEFSLPREDMDVLQLNIGLMKPVVRGELQKGPRMPLKLRRLD